MVLGHSLNRQQYDGGRVNLNPIRNLGIRGLGDSNLSNILGQDLIAYVNGGGQVSPDQFAGIIQGELSGYCANWGSQCTGDMLAQAQAVVDQYHAWYGGTPIQSQPNLSDATLNYLAGYGAAPPPATTQQNTLTNVAPQGPSITPSVAINGTGFHVGDTIRVVITGPPNTAVSLIGSKDGAQFPLTQVGTTDGNGNYVYSAVLTPDTVGSWTENWYLGNAYNYGGARAGSISFTVQASALNPPQGTNTGVNAGTITQNQQPPPQTTTGGSTSTDQAVSWLKDNWILVAAGLGAVIILPSLLKN